MSMQTHTITDEICIKTIVDFWNNQYNNTHSEAQNKVIKLPWSYNGAVSDTKVKVIPISKYKILGSTFCFLKKR